ncbi:unnamed protein product [Psylliodes chrysocephalus]|uniref:TIL domain-containing protein n=1 Tax=Psylliodes chrysocephalus TaxID=3402493 RepID=A0A9P0DEP0_9CUCU|nr:unnamed protein product [Psylliodes chrysocephala]
MLFTQTYLSCCLLVVVSVVNITPVYSNPQCPVHEFFNTAALKCTAEPTCQNPSPEPECGCVEDNCQQRCECNPGYIRDVYGKCIPISQCPCTECGENEVFNTCASSCDMEPTCYNRTPEVDSCCVPETIQRCECAPGYIRGPDGTCICIANCPCECGENEVFNTCASSCDIEPTCYNRTPEVDPCCVPETIQRCECAPGYIRGPDGTCICLGSCPCECGENEVFNTCASSCNIEPTCDNQTPVLDPCCVPETIQRCECAPGYVRDPSGKCICISSCPCCDPLTEVLCCTPCCEKTCQHPDGFNCRSHCNVDECVVGCVCKEHYTRDEETGKCVAVCYHKLMKHIHKPVVHHHHHLPIHVL